MASLALAYLNPGELTAHLAQHAGRVLGVAAFGHNPPEANVPGYPLICIDMPVLGANTLYEVWTSSTPVAPAGNAGIRSAHNTDVLYGCFETPQSPGESIESATFRAYAKLFDFIDGAGYPHLWRIWHYFPRINAIENELERYRGFNVGRHEAFLAKGRMIGGKNVPAACALGSRGGPMAMYFLAGKQAGIALENPRQTSAYHYPEQYGPRSPAFARAMLAGAGHDRKLFISGTASIVGHASQHAGDVAEQARETLANIRALLTQARHGGFDIPGQDPRLLLKVYLHRPDSLPLVRDQVNAAFGAMQQAVYLQADVCRSDLLLEIEGVCLYPRQTKNLP